MSGAFQNRSVLKWSRGKGPSSDSCPAAEGQSQAQHWAPQAWLRCLRGPGLFHSAISWPPAPLSPAPPALPTTQGWRLKHCDTERGLAFGPTAQAVDGKDSYSAPQKPSESQDPVWAGPNPEVMRPSLPRDGEAGVRMQPAICWPEAGPAMMDLHHPPLVAPPRLTPGPRPRAEVCGNRLSASMLRQSLDAVLPSLPSPLLFSHSCCRWRRWRVKRGWKQVPRGSLTPS